MEIKLNLNKLIKLRHQLHKNAEVALHEKRTARTLKTFIGHYNPDEIWDELGGYGLIFKFEGKNPGPNIGFRADMDALHIPETIDVEYASRTEHVSHKCGHDGHMTMVAGIADYLSHHPLEKGNVFLIFQPAEETGEGAQLICDAIEERGIKLDYIFGLHNLPNYPAGQVFTKSETFAAASKGMVIKLKGRTSHAAEPENGRSPVKALAAIIDQMTDVHKNHDFSALTLATVIHAELGEIAFGTTPGYAEIRITLRSLRDTEMKKLVEIAEQTVVEEAKKYKLKSSISYTDVFPVTENSPEIFSMLKEAAEDAELPFNKLEKAFKWSEDFGRFKSITTTGFFGLGAGEEVPNLHDDQYDFPDDIIESGTKMYVSLINNIINNDG